MSRETKVGLVVGLGFIVMFAVILSKKAGTVPYAELERDIAVGGEGTVQVVDSAFSSPAPAQEAPPTEPEPEERFVQSLPVRNDIAPEPGETAPLTAPRPTSDQDRQVAYPGLAPRNLPYENGIELPKVLANQDTGNQNQTMTQASPSAAPEPATVVNLPADVEDQPAPMSTPPVKAVPMANAPEEQVATPSASPGPKIDSPPVEAPKSSKPKPAPPEPSPLNDRKIKTKQYIAQAKDTLYKIAVMHYGTGHPDGVQRIFEANQDQLKSVDKLKIGQRLIIPEWEGAKGRQGFAAADQTGAVEEMTAALTLAAEKNKPANSPALKKVTTEKEKPELKFRIYEVQPNESFSTIAEREMGTMHLWKELHRANKDKIPTPEKLRVGAKIRIPLDLIAHNGEADDEED